MDIQYIWEKALSLLSSKVETEVFDRWIRPVRLISIEEGEACIEVPNKFFYDRIARDHAQQIKAALANVTGEEISVKLDVAEKEPELPWDKASGAQKTQTQASSSARLNPRYSFTNFIVGDNNRLAHAAALAVAQSPAKAYNPLFIYGGVGLGKTHLMQAIGAQAVHNKNTLKVLYITSEKFTNQMIMAIKNNRASEFRETYRTADVLLIDDIQFIANKDRTQEEMFNTFNTLYDAKKQIVVASDRALWLISSPRILRQGWRYSSTRRRTRPWTYLMTSPISLPIGSHPMSVSLKERL